MPLTRRVQVYINPAASDALDAIMQTLETGQTKAIEAALLGYAEDHGCYPTAIERGADVGTVMNAFTEKYAANLASNQPDTKLDRDEESLVWPCGCERNGEGTFVIRCNKATCAAPQVDKLDRSTERIDDVSELAPAGYLADHPLRDEYLEELKKPLPLERKQVNPLLKPSQRKGNK